jgi:hypothetical protein
VFCLHRIVFIMFLLRTIFFLSSEVRTGNSDTMDPKNPYYMLQRYNYHQSYAISNKIKKESKENHILKYHTPFLLFLFSLIPITIPITAYDQAVAASRKLHCQWVCLEKR